MTVYDMSTGKVIEANPTQTDKASASLDWQPQVELRLAEVSTEATLIEVAAKMPPELMHQSVHQFLNRQS